jgi:two-component system C4-dicarboxylate transport response regulator DctD
VTEAQSAVNDLYPAQEPSSVLVVDDDEMVAKSIGQWLTLNGFTPTLATSGADALARLAADDIDIVLTDVRMPGQDGFSLLKAVRQLRPATPVIMLTGHGDVPMAVEALKAGAFDFLTKPHDPDHLAAALRNAAALRHLSRRVERLESERTEGTKLESALVGHAPAMVAVRERIRAIAPLPVDVLIYGETGTGKEVVARALHDEGPRRGKPFVAVNCAAIPAELVESELFGHEAGAFTNARQARVGKFEYSHGGTLFLDEVESMPLAAQAKVLRVLQERAIERVGSNRTITLDLRVVAAAKGNLREADPERKIRTDLFFRLAGVELHIPPLRARPGDAELLFQWFAVAKARQVGRPLPSLRLEELQAISLHEWPGNVRELKATAERFALGLGLSLGDGDDAWQTPPAGAGRALPEIVDSFERSLIATALRRARGDVSHALAELGIPRRTLSEKLRKYGLRRGDFAVGDDSDDEQSE